MRIGVQQAYFSRKRVGGGELHTQRLGAELASRGHEVVVCTDRPAERRELRLPDGFEVREFDTPIKLNPLNELTLARAARDTLAECDVVLLTDESALLGTSLSVPTVMLFHIVWHGWLDRHGLPDIATKPQALVYAAMERRICRAADRVVAIAPHVRREIEQAGCTGDRIVDIPNGVDTERFHPDAAPAAEEFTVHFQGRLAAQKNPQLLVEAAARSEHPWQVTVGGAGPLAADLREAVAHHGLGDRVELLGYVDDDELPRRYASSHVCVLPSTYEGMPLTVLEAAASGTPSVVSPAAATAFVTDDTGEVVEPEPAALASVIDDLARDPERAETMGRRARDRAEQYSWERVAADYETLFRDLVEGTP